MSKRRFQETKELRYLLQWIATELHNYFWKGPMRMTLERLEERVNDLERQLAELRDRLMAPRGPASLEQTFGYMGNDPEYDEIVRLGREYRQQENNERP